MSRCALIHDILPPMPNILSVMILLVSGWANRGLLASVAREFAIESCPLISGKFVICLSDVLWL